MRGLVTWVAWAGGRVASTTATTTSTSTSPAPPSAPGGAGRAGRRRGLGRGAHGPPSRPARPRAPPGTWPARRRAGTRGPGRPRRGRAAVAGRGPGPRPGRWGGGGRRAAAPAGRPGRSAGRRPTSRRAAARPPPRRRPTRPAGSEKAWAPEAGPCAADGVEGQVDVAEEPRVDGRGPHRLGRRPGELAHGRQEGPAPVDPTSGLGGPALGGVARCAARRTRRCARRSAPSGRPTQRQLACAGRTRWPRPARRPAPPPRGGRPSPRWSARRGPARRRAPWRRLARTDSTRDRAAEAAAKAPSPKPTSGARPRTPADHAGHDGQHPDPGRDGQPVPQHRRRRSCAS